MKRPRNRVVSPKAPHWYRQQNSRRLWDVFDGKDKLVKADLTRREAASLIGEQWDMNGRIVGWL
jgi:hypothetical protein